MKHIPILCLCCVLLCSCSTSSGSNLTLQDEATEVYTPSVYPEFGYYENPLVDNPSDKEFAIYKVQDAFKHYDNVSAQDIEHIANDTKYIITPYVVTFTKNVKIYDKISIV